MFCPECGLQIPDNANFCSYCGKILSPSVTPYSQPTQPVQQDVATRLPRGSNYPPPKKSTSGQVAFAVIFMLIIGIVLIAVGAQTLYSTTGITMLAIGVVILICLLGVATRGQACLCLACTDCGDCDCDC